MAVQAGQQQVSFNQSDNKQAAESAGGGIATFQFQDNRSDSLLIQKMKDGANNSQQAKQTAQLQAIAQKQSVLDTTLQKKTGPATQLKTKITHTVGELDVDGEKETVGVAMNAELDPKDAVRGTATGTNTEWMQWIRSEHADANVVRGHLLNHDLGGFAVEENLYPISTEANGDHSDKVEQHIKDLLTQLNSEVKNKDEGILYYNVKVKEFDSYRKAQFICDWNVQLKGGKDSGTYTVNSDLGKAGKYAFGKHGKKSPADWIHKKKEKEEKSAEWDQYVAAGKINLVDGKAIQGWSTAEKILVGLGISGVVIAGLVGYFYYNPDKFPAFLASLMSNGKSAVDGLKEDL